MHLLCFTSSCNVTFISIQNFINIFFPSSRTDDGRNRKLYIVFSNIPKIVSGVKGRALWWPNHLWKLCLMPDESLHCHLEISLIIREENKSTDGKTWAFSIFRSLLTSFLWACNVAETRLNQPKEAQIITLPPQACRAGTRHAPFHPPLFLRWCIALEKCQLRPHDLYPYSPVCTLSGKLRHFF